MHYSVISLMHQRTCLLHVSAVSMCAFSSVFSVNALMFTAGNSGNHVLGQAGSNLPCTASTQASPSTLIFSGLFPFCILHFWTLKFVQMPLDRLLVYRERCHELPFWWKSQKYCMSRSVNNSKTGVNRRLSGENSSFWVFFFDMPVLPHHPSAPFLLLSVSH